jgi:hypothetical protein
MSTDYTDFGVSTRIIRVIRAHNPLTAGGPTTKDNRMSDSTTGQTINTILRLGLDPALRQAGYKRRAHTFRQARPDGVWRVINVQGNRWNEGNQGRFTLNLGIHFPQVRAIIGDPPLTMPPKEWDCELRARIGRLTPDRRDKWWQFDQRSDLQAIADDVVKQWQTYGQPWLDRYSDLRTARDELAPQDYLFAVAASLALDERDAARHYYAAWRAEPLFANRRIPPWVQVLGLDLEIAP